MRTLIVSLSLMVVSSTANSQQRPACLKMLDSKIISFEKGVAMLKDLSKTGTNQQFNNTLRRNETKEKGIRNYLENCKESNPTYDYSEINNKINAVVAEFKAITGAGTMVKAETKETNIKAGKVEIKTPEKVANPTNNYSTARQPACLKMVDSKMKSLEKGIAQLEEYAGKGDQFQLTLNRTWPKVNGIQKYMENCKESNPNYDYTEIDLKIKTAISRFEYLVESNEKVEANQDAINKQSSKLKHFISFIKIFPNQEHREEEKKNYRLADTKKILAQATDDRRSFNGLQKNYQEALTMMETSEFESRVFQEIDFEYARLDQRDARKELQKHLNNFTFLNENVFPENANLIKIQDYIQKLISKQEAVKSETLSAVLVSDFHGKNLNKILFTSNMSLNPEKASASDFKTAFEIGQPIKAVAYLDNTYHNIYGRTNRPTFKMEGSTNSGQIKAEGFQKAEGAKPYITFNIVQNGNSYTATPGDYPGTAMAMEYLSKFGPRVHSIIVRLGSYLGNAQGDAPESDVFGTFTIDASVDSGIDKMKKDIAGIRDKALAAVRLPKAGMNNSSFEKELVAMFNSIGWEEKFTKAIIGSSSFGYKKNYLDQVTGRTLQVYMVSKKSDGGCMYQDFTVIQEKVGSDWAPFKRLSTGSQKDISCSRL